MATMNISLPDQMKQWVEEQAANGRFANVSDYMRDLVRRDQEAVAQLQALIDEGVSSGVSDKSLDEIFAESRKRALARIRALADDISKDAAA